MPELDEVAAAVRAQLSAPRAEHCARVAETARRLALRHGLDPRDAELAGWLHDWYREVSASEIVALALRAGVPDADQEPAQVVSSTLHGPVAARLLPERWPDLSAAVLRSVDRHTTGAADMGPLDCLVYLADLLEPGHAEPELAELRILADQDLESATLAALEGSLRRLLDRGRPISVRTVQARNALLSRRGAPASGGPGTSSR